jgi:hypothetical protein
LELGKHTSHLCGTYLKKFVVFLEGTMSNLSSHKIYYNLSNMIH